MKNSILIGKKELTSVMVNLISIKMLLTFPRSMVISSGNAAWMEGILATVLTLILFWITTSLYKSKDNVITLAEHAGGKGLRIFIGVLLIIVLIANISSTMRAFPESVRTVLLPNSPIEFIILAFGISIAIGAYNGVESISRIHSIFLPIAGIVLIIFLILLFPHFKANNIFPVFGNGVSNIMFHGTGSISIFSDLIVLNLLLPFCKNRHEAVSSGFRSILISGFVVVIILLAYTFVYPYPTSTEFIMPVYQLTRIVKIGSFFERLEAFFEFVWSISMFLYASLYLYIICLVWQMTFNIRYYKPLIFPVVIIISTIAFIPSSVVDLLRFQDINVMIMTPLAFLLPIIFGIYSKARGQSK